MQKQRLASAHDALGERPSQVFYTAPATVARILCLLLAGFYAAMLSLMPLSEAMAALPALLPQLALGILGEVGLAYLLSRLSPIRIDDSGITLTDFWGRKRSLLWDEIESATSGRFLFVKFLKVAPARDHRVGPLLILMAVTRPEAFRDSLLHYASSANPVRRFLEGGDAS